MKVSTSWLSEYVAVTVPTAELADALTMVGLEVGAIADRYSYLETVFVGAIVAVEAHPNADRLHLCTVDIGTQRLRIVCGAPNARVGMLTACALPGTVLPSGTRISAGLIRGETSEGMLCSEAELGLGPDGSGIMTLGSQPATGTPLNRALGLTDPVLEIDLTPNRPDCLSILGIAREVAAIQGNAVQYPECAPPTGTGDITRHTSVTIESAERCPRYAARLIKGVTIGPSPQWLQDRLASIGLKPINNIVDVTNFVMMEVGQPLHAFDFNRLAGQRIVVRPARAGEPFTTLDGKARTLDAGMLLICDGEKPVALAGVMGGLNSEIEPDTVDVLIESACFNPASVRKTAKTLGLSTDASHRFERGVDPLGTVAAIDRAARLMVETAGGTVIGGVLDVHPKPFRVPVIPFSVAAANRRIGTQLTGEEMTALLEGIAFSVRPGPDGTRLEVTPPSFRVDIERFEDLTEEVARRYGYNHIATTYPMMPSSAASRGTVRDFRHRIREWMVGFGFTECITYSFIAAQSADRMRLAPEDGRRRHVAIRNPISEDLAVMRTSLVPGLLASVGRNQANQNANLMLFEIGNVFFATGNEDTQPEEQEVLAAVWTGFRRAPSWQAAPVPCDFFDLKGALEALLCHLGIRDAVFTRMVNAADRYLHPGVAAHIIADGLPLGTIGEIHPQVQDGYGLKQPVFLFEIPIASLRASATGTTYRPAPRYPSTDRDMTLIIDARTESQQVVRALSSMGEAWVERVALFDVYTGSPIAEGKKSISIRLTYRSTEGTLEDDSVNRLHQRISERIIEAFEASLPA
ncbi:MAG: phenylalanine--tRNA ligase subunit beta [Pseudomonadota bacterium]